MLGRLEKDRPLGRAFASLLEWILRQQLKRRLHGVYLKGELPPGPLVLAATHQTYFDGHFVHLLLGRGGHLLLEEANLRVFPYFRLLGGLSAKEVRKALGVLKGGGRVGIFPEGALRPQGPIGPLKRGAVYLAKRTGVPLVPAVFRVYIRGFELPEAYLRLGPPVAARLEELAEAMASLAQEVDALQEKTHPRRPLPGFSLLLKGTRGLDEWLGGSGVVL